MLSGKGSVPLVAEETVQPRLTCPWIRVLAQAKRGEIDLAKQVLLTPLEKAMCFGGRIVSSYIII